RRSGTSRRFCLRGLRNNREVLQGYSRADPPQHAKKRCVPGTPTKARAPDALQDDVWRGGLFFHYALVALQAKPFYGRMRFINLVSCEIPVRAGNSVKK